MGTFSIGEEKYKTVTGLRFEAIKYIPISLSENHRELVCFIELGWEKFKDSVDIHANPVYLTKKETLVKTKL